VIAVIPPLLSQAHANISLYPRGRKERQKELKNEIFQFLQWLLGSCYFAATG